ncbi:MAG: adenylyltransferase/cytidyltransferase family protein [Deltaproteobacteria bacterium]|nr:adenylyltransferase/cytidyltransferase family protein [Deltaproteobacteria bacterium]MBW2305862.1 adenylyltransferase/cytidyltransferase family protein [Deltaproteobacteria bacterium]
MDPLEPARIRSLENLIPEIEQERQRGKTIVFANGCFDLLHVGHIRYLRGARACGDLLIVAVNSDESARRIKGPGRPFMPLSERMEILAELRCVHYILPFDDSDVSRLLLSLRPHIHAKGTDYTEESVPERQTVWSYGGRIAITGDPKEHSSTEMLKKAKKRLESG